MKYRVFYAKDANFYESGTPFGAASLTLENLGVTHVEVAVVEAEGKEDVFSRMQWESWGVGDYAAFRERVQALGITHGSMSVSDALIDEGGRLWEVAQLGFILRYVPEDDSPDWIKQLVNE